MILTREGIQRMIDGAGNGAAGGGGGDISALLAGYATESWVDENYLSIEFFSKLFKAYNSANPAVEIKPNDTQSTITNIKAMFGFWTEQYLSALGQNAAGGGGGVGDVTWDALADNTDTRQIALSHLTTALSGYATQSWVNTQGYLTAITSSQIITALGYTPANNADLSNYLPLTAGSTKTLTGQLVSSVAIGTAPIAVTSTTVCTNLNADLLDGQHGSYYAAASSLSNYLPLSGGTITGTSGDTPLRLISHDNDCWIEYKDEDNNSLGFIGCNVNGPSYYGSAGAKQIALKDDLSNYLPLTGGIITGSLTVRNYLYAGEITTNTYFTINAWSGYGEGHGRLWYNGISNCIYCTNGFVVLENLGIGVEPTDYRLKVNGTIYASGLISALGNITTSTNDGAYVQIGNAKLVWDNINNALKLTKIVNNAEVAVNFYATGGVSALGYGVSGGGGAGDVTWEALESSSDERPIALSHLTGALAGYATTSQLAGYLPLTGGTLTGNSDTPLYIKSSGENSYICFKNNNDSILGYLGVNSNHNPYFFYDTFCKIWTAGNDGAGSGLDADLLDGHHYADMVTDIGVSGSTLTWTKGGVAQTALTIPYATNTSHLNAARQDSIQVPSVYRAKGNGLYSEVGYYSNYWGTRIVAIPWHDSTGGYPTEIFIHGTEIQVRTGTDESTWGSAKMLAYTTSNVSTATALQTSRTIWGQSFDGTADISGALSNATSIAASGNIDSGASITAAKYFQIRAWPEFGTGFANMWYDNTDNNGLLKIQYAKNININGSLMWHAGNDGAGSGLDADLLDGIDSTIFLNRLYENGTYNYGTTYPRFLVLTWNKDSDNRYRLWVSAPDGARDATVGVDFATNAAVATRSQYIETWYGDMSHTYGNSYKCYIYWETSSVARFKTEGNYPIRVSQADTLVTSRNIWGKSFNGSADITGTIEAGSSGGAIEGFQSLELNTHNTAGANIGGFIDFHYNGTSNYSDYSLRLIESTANVLSIQAKNTSDSSVRAGLEVGKGYDYSYIDIGGARIVYRADQNALRITNPNGGAMNLYATGGVSALGMDNISATGSVGATLVPSTTATYDLGSSNYKWRNLYMSGNGTNFSITNNSNYTYLGTSKYFSFGGDIYLSVYGIHIGNIDRDYDLYVDGETGKGYFSDELWADSFNRNSDMRLKNVLSDFTLDLNAVSNAPLFTYMSKNGKQKVKVGSSAQYWDIILPQTVARDADGMLSLDYSLAAFASVVSLAKYVSEHERRIAKLEAENAILRAEIEDLKAA